MLLLLFVLFFTRSGVGVNVSRLWFFFYCWAIYRFSFAVFWAIKLANKNTTEARKKAINSHICFEKEIIFFQVISFGFRFIIIICIIILFMVG